MTHFFKENLLPLPMIQEEQYVGYWRKNGHLILVNCLQEACLGTVWLSTCINHEGHEKRKERNKSVKKIWGTRLATSKSDKYKKEKTSLNRSHIKKKLQ